MNHGADMAANSLARCIRGKLADGTLPRERQGELWVGYGNGARCDGCDRTITPNHVEHEVVAGGRTLRLHLDCLYVWEHARFGHHAAR